MLIITVTYISSFIINEAWEQNLVPCLSNFIFSANSIMLSLFELGFRKSKHRCKLGTSFFIVKLYTHHWTTSLFLLAPMHVYMQDITSINMIIWGRTWHYLVSGSLIRKSKFSDSTPFFFTTNIDSFIFLIILFFVFFLCLKICLKHVESR